MSRIAAAVLAFFVLVMLPATTTAQIIPQGNVYVGASYGEGDLVTADRTPLRGWNASVEGKVFPHIGIVLDGSGYYNNAGVTQYNALLGPRISASFGNWRPFAQVLFGVGRENDGGTTTNSIEGGLGGGVDYKLIKAFSWRLQGDYLRTGYFSARQNDVRVSTGIVFRF